MRTAEENGAASDNEGETESQLEPPLLYFHISLHDEPFRFPTYKGFEPRFDEPNKVLIYPSKSQLRLVSCSTESPFNSIESLTYSLGADYAAAIKFSPDAKYGAVQKSVQSNEIHFFSLDGKINFVQQSRRLSTILQFHFTDDDILLVVTTTGIELYQIPLDGLSKPSLFGRPGLRLLKEFKMPVHWSVYSPGLHMLVVSSGTSKQYNSLQPFYFTEDFALKLPRLDLHVADINGTVQPQDIALCKIYGQIFCIYLNKAKRQMVGYQITREAVIEKFTYVLHTTGRLFLHIVDNLIILHDIDSKISVLYDIKDRETGFPLAGGLPLAPFQGDKSIELYSEKWKIYQPNLVLDTESGYLFQVQINLQQLSLSFSDHVRLVEFLVRRSDGKMLLLELIRTMIEEGGPLSRLAKIFDIVNSVMRSLLLDTINTRRVSLSNASPQKATQSNNHHQTGQASPSRASSFSPDSPAKFSQETMEMWETQRTKDGYVVLEQSDMYAHVFLPIDDYKDMDSKFFIAVLVEYVRSLSYYQIQVQDYFYKLMISLLVRHNRFYQLHQFLQYHIINDSVHVACQLLSLEKTYPPCYQMALDMLKRLSVKSKVVEDQIIEVLLTSNQILPALRFIRTHASASYMVTRFLEAALCTGDDTLCYSVYRFFEKRNELTPECAPYIKEFKRLIWPQPPPPPTSTTSTSTTQASKNANEAEDEEAELGLSISYASPKPINNNNS